MSHSITIPHYRPAGRDRGHGHHVAFSVLLAVIIGGLAFAIVELTFDVVRGALAEETATAEPTIEFAAREIPREWQWHPSGVAVEHMHRQHKPDRIDWIRNGGAL